MHCLNAKHLQFQLHGRPCLAPRSSAVFCRSRLPQQLRYDSMDLDLGFYVTMCVHLLVLCYFLSSGAKQSMPSLQHSLWSPACYVALLPDACL